MVAGYDRRQSTGEPTQIVSQRLWVPGDRQTGRVLVKKESVMSFRTVPTGEYVPDHVADPYAWMMNSSQAEKRAMAEANGLARKGKISGKQKPTLKGIVDRSHPYTKEVQEIATSHTRTDYTHGQSSSSGFITRGGPLWANQAQVASAHRGRIPFPLSVAGASYTTGYSIPLISTSDLASVGADAIGRVAPSSDGVNLPLMVGELVRDLPRVIGASLFDRGASVWKMGANEFLNYVFGIAPTVRDLALLAETLMSLSQRILQIQRDAGRGVRRSYGYPVRTRNESFDSSELSSQGIILMAARFNDYGPYQAGDFGSRVYGGNFVSELHAYEEVRDFFNGSFTYYLPKISGFETRVSEYMASMNKLFHLQPSSQAVYQLTPWSWLLDWAYDVGSLLRTAEVVQDDNLVINYGTATRLGIRTLRQSTRVASDSTPDNPSYGTVHTVRRSFKMQRIRANPYGFVSPLGSAFTPMRLAILAALGISRSGR